MLSANFLCLPPPGNPILFFLTRGFLEIRRLPVLPVARAKKCLSAGEGVLGKHHAATLSLC